MPRHPSAMKRSMMKDKPLSSVEAHRFFKHGDDVALEDVEQALQIVSLVSTQATNRRAKAFREKACGFLADWLVGMTTSRNADTLRRLASRIAKRGLFDAADPVAARLVSYGIQCAEIGEKVRDTLKRLPMDMLMHALASRGIKADETTVRRTLNQLGVKRPPGRPKKPRNS